MSDQPSKPRGGYKQNPVGRGYSIESENPINGAQKKATLRHDVVNGNPRQRIYDNQELPNGEMPPPWAVIHMGVRPFSTYIGALAFVRNRSDSIKVPIEIPTVVRDGEGKEIREDRYTQTMFIGRDKNGVLFIAYSTPKQEDTPKFPILPSYWGSIPNKELSMEDISNIECEGLLRFLTPLMASVSDSTFPTDGTQGGGGGGSSDWRSNNRGGGNGNYNGGGNGYKKNYGGGNNGGGNGYKKNWNGNGGGGNGNYNGNRGGNNGNYNGNRGNNGGNGNYNGNRGGNGGGNYNNNRGGNGGGNGGGNNRPSYNPSEDLPI